MATSKKFPTGWLAEFSHGVACALNAHYRPKGDFGFMQFSNSGSEDENGTFAAAMSFDRPLGDSAHRMRTLPNLGRFES